MFLRKLTLTMGAFACASLHALETDALAAGFATPPAESRPMTLWFWMNGHISKEGITLDLEAMSEVGLGGAMIFDGSNYFPEGPVTYMSEEWLDCFTHAVREGDRLGINIGMHNAPGWSSSGGPWITPKDSMKYLTWTTTAVSGGESLEIALPQPYAVLDYYEDERVIAFPTPAAEAVPFPTRLQSILHNGEPIDTALLLDEQLTSKVELMKGDTLVFAFDAPISVASLTVVGSSQDGLPRLLLESSEDGESYVSRGKISPHGQHGIVAPTSLNFPQHKARYFRLTAESEGDLGEATFGATSRIRDWEFKTNLAFRVGRQMSIPDAGTVANAIDPDSVQDLSANFGEDGVLRWQAPPGDWTILRLGYTTTGHLNVAASASGTGLECDKLDPAAAELHFDNTIARVIKAVGPLAGKSFKYVEVDSYEAGMQNWTPRFPEAFERRAGYDLTPYLPALTGRIVGDAAQSERFLFDFRKTQASMMAENYYGHLEELVTARGLDFYVEGYGQGVFDEMEVSGRAQNPMTEFWTRTPWTPNRTMKLVSSAAHVYGKSVVAAEAFTGEESTSRWLNHPYALKAEGDYMFSLGLNQMIFHRYAHQPHPSAVPGMAMGPWGFHFERTNTWFPHAKGWLDYLARCQFMLRQGIPVADALFFTGERPPNVAQWLRPSLPEGFDYDLIDARTLVERLTFKDGAYRLPEGGIYQLLVLPATLRGATPEFTAALAKLAAQGAPILGPWPEANLSLEDPSTPPTAAPLLPSDLTPGEALAQLGVEADLTYTAAAPDAALSWVHRSLPAGELYFVGNRQRRTEEVVASFRVDGGSAEIWDAETGERHPAPLVSIESGRTVLPLRLGPSASRFIFFPRESAPPTKVPVFQMGAKTLQTTEAFTSAEPPTATDTFTMAVWAKPEIDLRQMPKEKTSGKIDETGKFYVIAAPEGDRLFGPGHHTAGLAVGRNGAYVIERSSEASPAVLVSTTPIDGWNHFAVVYRDGTPSLYINGRWNCDGQKTGATVHPGIGLPKPPTDAVLHFNGLDGLARASEIPLPPTQGRTFHFEGNFDPPQLFDRALTAAEIAELARATREPPFAPPPAEIRRESDGSYRLTAWESGSFSLGEHHFGEVEVADSIPLQGPWKIAFQPGRGAPDTVVFPELQSLHRHGKSGIRHFSGEATYQHTFKLPAGWFAADRRVVLDLGRVEVIASVAINGVPFADLWKEPYQVDITDAVQAGTNALSVTVTTLWTNRLIGDATHARESLFGYDDGQPDSPFYGKGIRAFPDWFLAGEPAPDDAPVTFTTWDFYGPEEPLVSSGLLGPVLLRNPVERRL